MSRSFPFALLAVLVVCGIGATAIAGWVAPTTLTYLPGILLATSLVAFAFGLSWKLGGDSTYFLVFFVILIVGGFVWLTRHPDSVWLERAEQWKFVGPWASAIREAYLPPEPLPRTVAVDDRLFEISVPTLEETAAQPRAVESSSRVPKAESRQPAARTQGPAKRPAAELPVDPGTKPTVQAVEPTPRTSSRPDLRPEPLPTPEIPLYPQPETPVEAESSASSADTTGPPLPAEFVEALAEAEMLLDQDEYKEAVQAFKRAGKLTPEPVFRCVLGLSASYNRVGAYKNGERKAREALAMAEHPFERAAALNQLGVSLFASGRASPEQMGKAAEAFREVLDLAGNEANVARYNLGEVLLRLGRDEEGLELLHAYLKQEPKGAFAKRARDLIKNPMRARVNLVPDFEIVTLQGEYLTSFDLQGKVVLLDFWASWCKPCLAALPYLRRLSKKSGKQPFVIVSISTDSDETMLRSFVQKHRMTWPQIWDQRHEIARLFDVRSYPTYIVLDSDGVMVYRKSGWSDAIGNTISGRVNGALRRARKTSEEARK